MQNYNNLLSAIKRSLGAKLNLLEMSDAEIIDGIKEDVIPFFSQYSPLKKYCMIGNSQLIPFVPYSGNPQWSYLLPLTPEEYIIDVIECYISHSGSLFSGTKYNSGMSGSINVFEPGVSGVLGSGLVDIGIDNVYSDIISSFSTANTWELMPPKTIVFDSEIQYGIVVYNTIHEELNTIMPDYFHRMFKPLCIANVKLWIAALRSKYENIETPMGQLRMNWQKLEQEAQQSIEQIKQQLERIPPDHYIYFK